MHTVFCLGKDDALRALEDLVRDFHFRDTELFVDLLAHRRAKVVERRQTMHKYRVFRRL